MEPNVQAEVHRCGCGQTLVHNHHVMIRAQGSVNTHSSVCLHQMLSLRQLWTSNYNFALTAQAWGQIHGASSDVQLKTKLLAPYEVLCFFFFVFFFQNSRRCIFNKAEDFQNSTLRCASFLQKA